MSHQVIMEMAAQMEQASDLSCAAKVRELDEKRQANQVEFAFCGHFSAGKSSLVNRLCGHTLLPSSPIPTSANVVTIRSGEPSATVTRETADGKEQVKIKLEELDDYCKDGTVIQTMDIHYPIDWLADRGALLDTPGIDSTDDAHRLATESALHLADVVFYVMDYNHVQSEMNFAFTKKVQEWGKPLYLIVNQIDKHRENELSFAAFRESVQASFANWNIQPNGIFFLTLKQMNHPHNEWEKLNWLLRQLLKAPAELNQWSVERSLEELLEQHQAHVKAAHQHEREAWIDAMGGETAEQEETMARYNVLKTQLASKQQRELEQLEQWKSELNYLLANANITPAATRDLAHRYLESRKPGFKVGWFARASQTEKEIAERLQVFYDDLSEKVHAHVFLHLKGMLKQWLDGQSIRSNELLQEIETWEHLLTTEWLAAQVKSGAVFSNEYTVNYCKLVSSELMGLYRQKVLGWIDALLELCRPQWASELAEVTAQCEQLEHELSAYRKLQDSLAAETEYFASLSALVEQVLTGKQPKLPDLATFADTAVRLTGKEHSADAVISDIGDINANAAPAIASSVEANAEDSGEMAVDHGLLKRTAARLREAARSIQPIPAMESRVQAMLEKAARLEENRFTIALFGAFSAGKSSFANALMGERILPVSPNPTTAAVNKIVPPTNEAPHGTARVYMKSQEAMVEEVAYSLRFLGLEAGDWKQCLRQIEQLAPDRVSANGKPHYTFLKAVNAGWEETKEQLGKQITVDLAAFTAYVAEERLSCYVDSIELHYDHALTRHGMTFVDTPGADSINARHTGVAFNYIKNADVIVFVTYYNHAFSQADREFLLQLGRVKDAFELDKMYFIVNAADLAYDQQELDQVVEHVRGNLLQHGVRQPRIFPLSSQMAVEGEIKQNAALRQQSGMVAFERDFMQFTFGELAQIAVQSAMQDIQRAADVLHDWMEEANQGEAKRQQRLLELNVQAERVKDALLGLRDDLWKKELQDELTELLYYVKQRVTFRFGDFYNMAFNPASLTEDGRDVRQALSMCWKELVRLISYDLSQEVLATTLRIENFLQRKGKHTFEEGNKRIREHLPTFAEEAYRPHAFITPDVAEALQQTDVEAKWLAGMFKNGKAFFEGDGKAAMRVELEQRLAQPIQMYSDAHMDTLFATYVKQYEAALSTLLSQLDNASSAHVSGVRNVLEANVSTDEFAKIFDKLQSILA